MAKTNEQKVAKTLYVEHFKDAKEISQLLGVSEVTLSKWVTKGNWKDLRNARLCVPEMRIDNIKQIINDLSERRIKLGSELREYEQQADPDNAEKIRMQIAQVDDAVSKWNKTLTTVHKENQVSLSTYLSVMTLVFEALKIYDQKLYYQTLDFQEVHLNEVSIKFK